MFKQTKTLGISLSGGGSKALSFFGFVRALQSKGIEISMFNAHSAGGWVLAYMNSGMTDDQILEQFRKLKLYRFASLNPIKNGGFLKLDKLFKHFKKVSDKNIEDLPVKTIITTSDLKNINYPKVFVFDKGPLWRAVVISAIIPPFMPLYEYEDHLLCDGGYLSLYNVGEFKKNNIDKVIGLFPEVFSSTKIPSLFRGLVRAQQTIIARGSNYERTDKPVDLEVKFDDIKFGLTDFKQAKHLFELGFNKGLKYVDQVKALVS